MNVEGAHSDRGEQRASSQTRRLGPAILRIAGWPIETLDSLRSERLVKRIDDWIGNDDAIRHESEALALELYQAIPRLGDREIRRLALELKRFLHGAVLPPPEHLAERLLKHDIIHQTVGPALLMAMDRRKSHAAERASIELAHAAELERASRALDGITSDDRFLRALCLASPSTFQQWQNARAGSSDRRSRQRLQSTLHRYLMRAIGRATPNGLWAGIALEDMASEGRLPLQVAPAAPLSRVSPALSVLVRGLENLVRRRPWIDLLAWRRNPTLRRVNNHIWEFGTFANGSWCVRRVAHHAPLEVLVERFSLTDRPMLQEIADRLCHHLPNMTPAVVRELIEAWIDAGLLWSTTALPAFYTNTWEALDAIIETLPPTEKPIWRDCRKSLKQIANEIEAGIERLQSDSLRDLLEDARRAVATVLCRYEATVPRGQCVLVLDRTAPFRFSVSPGLAQAIEQSLRTYWRFDRYGLGEIETRIAIHHFFGAVPDRAHILLGEFLTRGAESEPVQQNRSWQDRVLSRATGEHLSSAREAFSRWEREIEPCFGKRTHRLATDAVSAAPTALPPGSALLLLGVSNEGVSLRIGGVTPEPCFFYSRFSHLFGNDDRTPDAFLKWQRTVVAEAVSQGSRLEFLDLAIRNHLNPNVVARPHVASRMVDPLDAASPLLQQATISCNSGGRPVLSSAGSTRLLIPSARSAAVLGDLDRFASVLASVSLFLGRPPLLAPMPRLAREIDNWHHLPRLMLADTIISAERWTPEASFGLSLANARGAERLIQWRRFVRQSGLPNLVYTFQGRHQTESLLATDSAIGVELLGQELKAQGPSIRIQELFPAPENFVVQDDDGKRYVAELAVAWSGDEVFWRDYVDSTSPAGLDAGSVPHS
jgi:Lantibiotic dehydratase, N terminus